MRMWDKNPKHLNKYKGTATEQDYKHNQLHQLLYSWTNDCSEGKKKIYINFHIYIYIIISDPIHMHSAVAFPLVIPDRSEDFREHL